MATDNTVLPPGGNGDTIRTINRAGVKTQVIQLDVGGEAGPESLVTSTNALPVSVGNFPAPQPVPISAPLGALPSTSSISVTLAADSPALPIAGTVLIGNVQGDGSQAIPVVGATQDDIIAVAGVPITPGAGVPVSVTNLPAVQAVNGAVSVSNFPAAVSNPVGIQPAITSLSVTQATDNPPVPVTGAVTIANLVGDISQEIPVVGRVTDDIVAVAGVPIAAGSGVPVTVLNTVSPPTVQSISSADGALTTLGSTTDLASYTVAASTIMAQVKAMNDALQSILQTQQNQYRVLQAILAAQNATGGQLGAAPIDLVSFTLQ